MNNLDIAIMFFTIVIPGSYIWTVLTVKIYEKLKFSSQGLVRVRPVRQVRSGSYWTLGSRF